jgi:carboxyl-terminal processing protease
MRDGSAVKITTARYFTPKGRDINAVGIQPEIKADLPKDLKGIHMGDPNTDPQLIAAIAYLNARIAQTATATAPAAVTPTTTH